MSCTGNKGCACGCCDGISITVPHSTENGPGLSAIGYRIGTHATFFESLLARIPAVWKEVAPQADELRARETTDMSIALLDGWATIADVLTFYQERIANEGYLRTATERRSLVELGRLVGYQPRPGVSASAYLAFELEDAYDAIVPAGTKVQSVPKPGEDAQTFETSEAFQAWSITNAMKPRLSAPYEVTKDMQEGKGDIWLKGTSTQLKIGSVLVLDGKTVLQVAKLKSDPAKDQTTIVVAPYAPVASAQAILMLAPPQPAPPPAVPPPPAPNPGGPPHAGHPKPSLGTFDSVLADLVKKAAPAARRFPQLSDVKAKSQAALKVTSKAYPWLRNDLYRATRGFRVETGKHQSLHVLRETASVFGFNAPLNPKVETDNTGAVIAIGVTGTEWPLSGESATTFFLDGVYEGIAPGSVVVFVLGDVVEVNVIKRATVLTRSAYNISAKATCIELEKPVGFWNEELNLGSLRALTILVRAEALPLGEAPIDELIEESKPIELDALVSGIDAGRLIIVSGERADLGGGKVRGVVAAELAVVGKVEHEARGDVGGAIHTHLSPAAALQYKYFRESVVVYGNVAHATHGETTSEVLGSGSAATPLQTFKLKRKPLTFVAAPTPSGTESTLEVRVNDVLWPEAKALSALGPTDEQILTKTGDDDVVSVIGGNGVHGARFPTGRENLTAHYRVGIGRGGNVDADSLTLLQTKPAGVKGVRNPIRASGGADRDDPEQIRELVPYAVGALERLISIDDYAAFARTFAGVTKAAASMGSSPGGWLVDVTIAGQEDAPIDVTSDLYRNLLASFRRYGSPERRVRLAVARPRFLILSAGLGILPRYLFEKVEAEVRRALLDAFAYRRRGLGQAAVLSDLASVMQRMPGVTYVDVDVFGATSGVAVTPQSIEDDVKDAAAQALQNGGPPGHVVVQPDEVAYFDPEFSAGLVLTELPG
jgi:hypothetical protein